MTYNTNTNMKMSLIFAAAICAATMITSNVQAAEGWFGTTITASTGTVDEKDLDKVEFRSGRARIKESINSGRVTLRYDVQLAHDEPFRDCEALKVYLRFKDNGRKSRIVAKLKGYDMFTGITETLITFDSDDFDADDDYQRQFALEGQWRLNPSEAYFLEVTLIKQSPRGAPEIGAMEIWVADV